MKPKPPIPIGTHIKMSELGAHRCPRIAKKHGIVISGSRNPSTIHIRFDGNICRTMLHMDYVEPIGPTDENPEVGKPKLIEMV
jgi:hypothetical protein